MRTVRHRKPENFLSAIARNGHGIFEEEELSATQSADEALVMGLRLTEGIDVEATAKRFGVPKLIEWERVHRLERSGHVKLEGPRVQLTQRGRLLLDYILADIAALDTTVLAVAD
jgi:oxygen-independent coproporphyrinogen-3 oxidase